MTIKHAKILSLIVLVLSFSIAAYLVISFVYTLYHTDGFGELILLYISPIWIGLIFYVILPAIRAYRIVEITRQTRKQLIGLYLMLVPLIVASWSLFFISVSTLESRNQIHLIMVLPEALLYYIGFMMARSSAKQNQQPAISDNSIT